MWAQSSKIGWILMLILGLYRIAISIIGVAVGYMDVFTGFLLATSAAAIISISLESFRRRERWSWWCLLVLGLMPLVGRTINVYILFTVGGEVTTVVAGWLLFITAMALSAKPILGDVRKPLILAGILGLLLGTAVLAYFVLVPQWQWRWSARESARERILFLYRLHALERQRELLKRRLEELHEYTLRPPGWLWPPLPLATEIVEAELKKLAPGRILFNPSEEMTVGVKERVEVRIARTLTEDLTTGLRGRGVPQVEEIRVGTFMKVCLTGDNFDIKALSHEEQVVAGEGFTQWDYDVVPLKSGTQTLLLTVTVRIKIPNYGEERKDCHVLERKIKVKVNRIYSILRFAKSYWQWIVTTIVATITSSGITGLILKRRSNSRKNSGRSRKT